VPEEFIYSQEKKGKSRLNFPGLEVPPVFIAYWWAKKKTGEPGFPVLF